MTIALRARCLECDNYGNILIADTEHGPIPRESAGFNVYWAEKVMDNDLPKPTGAKCKICDSRLVKFS